MNFCEALALIRDGALVVQATEEFQDVVTSVIEHGKSGSFTLKLKVDPNGEGTVTITPDISAKQAKAGVGKAVFYADDGGNLMRRDPRQRDIDDVLKANKEH